jgi:hypothetical protein
MIECGVLVFKEFSMMRNLKLAVIVAAVAAPLLLAARDCYG